MEIQIRDARLKDSTSIINFQLRMAVETEGVKLNKEILIKGVESVFLDSSKACYFVAEIDDKIIGSFMITYEWSDWRNGTIIWLQSVYILPEYRRKHVFSLMYKFLINKINSTNEYVGLRLYVDKNNIHAQKVYTSLGMSSEHYKTFEWMK